MNSTVHPGTEIIVVRYNQPDLEQKCISSVVQHTDLGRNNLKVVDNYGTRENLGALWNRMISESSYQNVCLLNSDTEVEEGWLEKLVEVADDAAVGPMTDRCGVEFQRGEKTPEKSVREVATLSGFCLLLPRVVWQKAGGFREDCPFYGQESNFLDRVPTKLLRGDVFVRHHAGGSIKAEGDQRLVEEKRFGAEFYRRNRNFDWGIRLAVIGSGPGNPFPLWQGIDQAIKEFKRERMKARHFCIRDKSLHEKLRMFSPDVAVVVNTKLPTLRKAQDDLRGIQCLKAIWFNDLRPEGYTMKGHDFDAVFLCWSSTWGDFIPSAWGRSFYMPQGCQIRPRLRFGDKILRDFVFIGSMNEDVQYHKDRRSLIEKIRQFGYEVTVLNFTDRERRIVVEGVSPHLYRSSKFCLVASPPAPGYNSLRMYNVLSYGGLAAIRHFPDVDRLLTPDLHALVFSDVQDLDEQCRELAVNPEVYESIRQEGWRLSQAKHTVALRLQNIVANLTSKDDSFWGYL